MAQGCKLSLCPCRRQCVGTKWAVVGKNQQSKNQRGGSEEQGVGTEEACHLAAHISTTQWQEEAGLPPDVLLRDAGAMFIGYIG